MSLIFSSHNPSLLYDTPTTTTAAASSAVFRHPISSLSFPLNPKPIKKSSLTSIIRFCSNKPPSSSSDWNPSDQTLNDDEESDGSQPPTVTDEWGEKAEPENEPLTKLSTSDPPKDDDEWGPPEPKIEYSGNGTPVIKDVSVEGDDKVEDLKRCLVDSVYGTGLGFSASQEERAEILELVNQLEAVNPTNAPTDSVELLDGNWVVEMCISWVLSVVLSVGALVLGRLGFS
ncbi:plastoglobulin-1, chloroplastic-like [Rutidosis leptorrhynchoides]|uniref:plastoglobulin-1, chloroplastic-like n=1 Tax=Rutidosis leptorrhynchoides TaxID=125765 RepID=UPI003A9967BE